MTARQIAKSKISDANADEIFHSITNGLEHTANLAVNSLAQNDAQAIGRHGMKLHNFCSMTVQNDAAQQFRRKFGVPRPIQCHFVFFLNFVTWMREALCEISIICEKKETFALCVQTPNVEQPREFCRQQIKNSIAHMRISPARNESGGLVQHDGKRWRDVNMFAVHLNVVALAGLRAEVSAGLTVDSDAARRNQFITMPARSDTGRGEETIKAHKRAY
jgi:hypothetical protein